MHPTAVVHPGAVLGAGVEIGPYCVVESGVRLEDGVRLAPYVHLSGSTSVGEGTSIGTGSAIGGAPQDGKYKGEPSAVRIGARCTLFEHVTVHRATGEGRETVIEDGAMLMAGSHVAHNARVGEGAILVNNAAIGGHTEIGARAFISAGAGVHQFCRVGRLTLVGGNAAVTRDAPPFSIVTGAYPLRWRAPNTVGLRRAGFSAEDRDALRHALARLFVHGASPVVAARELERHPIATVRELAAFVLASKRGVCSGSRRTTEL